MNSRRHSLGDEEARFAGLRLRKPELSKGGRTYREIEGEGNVALRLVLGLPNGAEASYPYSQIGLIELPNAQKLVLHGSCPLIASIEIHGTNLVVLARLLSVQRLASVSVNSGGTFSTESVSVTDIRVLKA